MNFDFILKEEKKILKKFFKKNILGFKIIADVIESLIAAFFFNENNFYDSLKFISNLGIIENLQIFKYKDFLKENILIEEKILYEFDSYKESIFVDMNFEELFHIFNPQKKYVYEKKNYLEELQQNLNYKFKKIKNLKNFLQIKSEKYERLEFLGDAILDIYSIINFYNLSKRYKIKINTDTLHSLKVFLLSSEPLSNFCIKLNLYKYFIFKSESENNKKNILKFLKNCSIKKKVQNMWFLNSDFSPKILSDSFEALIGAVFEDSGFKGVKKILDIIFLPFIFYFLKFNKKIILDIKKLVMEYFRNIGIDCGFFNNSEKVFMKINNKTFLEEFIEGRSLKSVEIQICMKFTKNKDYYVQLIKNKF